MVATKAGFIGAKVYKGVVLDVDISAYTLTVAGEFSKKPLSGVSFATPYQHFVNGEGIYFMPEVSSMVWICEPSDGGMPFVLAWSSAQDEGNFRARKQDLNPGDIYLGTRDGNSIWLRRGGILQMGGGPLCQRMFLPVDNTIKDFCQNYGLYSLAGQLEWTVQRQETDTTGHSPTELVLSAKQFADDSDFAATLSIGSHQSENDAATIVKLVVNNNGNTGNAAQFTLTIDNAGNLNVTLQQNATFNITGNWNLNVTGNIAETATGTATVTGQQGATITSPAQTTVEGDGGVNINAPITNVSQILVVAGGGGGPVALAGPLISWLASHVHQIIVPVPGTPTGPPVVPPLPNIAAESLTTT